MAITLTQTDTAAPSNGSITPCGITSFHTGAANLSDSGATAGTTASTVSVTSSGSDAYDEGYISSAGTPNSTSWEAGTWTVRYEVTTANKNLTLGNLDACRTATNGANVAVVGRSAAINLVLGTVGVISGTLTGSAQSAAATDVMLTYAEIFNTAMSVQAVTFKRSQNIDTPVTQGGAATGLPPGLGPMVGMEMSDQCAGLFNW